MAGMAPSSERAPRRGRTLLPAGLPRRRELLAACAVAVLVVHLLLAQLTLVLLVLFTVTGRATRWRWWWLLGPAAAGLAWTLVIGPGQALAGFAAGPSDVLRLLGPASGADGATWDAGHSLGVLAGVSGWLPRQFPLALPLAAAEAALLGWLAWLRTDEWAVPPTRPGMVAALRAAVATRLIEDGAVLTREGCALGAVAATGAIAELRWAEAAAGVLVVGAAERPAALACLQLVHAALRRRKPVIVLDDGQSGALLAALQAACTATGTPLRHGPQAGSVLVGRAAPGGGAAGGAPVGDAGLPDAGLPDAGWPDAGWPGTAEPGAARPAGGTASASDLWGRGQGSKGGQAAVGRPQASGPEPASLRQVVSERSAVLLAADGPDRAARACADLGSLSADLSRIGVDSDALVWVPHAELVPVQALAALLRDGGTAGLAVLAATTSAATATELAPVAGTVLIRRVTDPGLAAALAARACPAVGGGSAIGGGPAVRAGPSVEKGPAVGMQPGAAAPDLVPVPVVSSRALLGLGEAEFVLAVSAPRRRLVAPGRLVPARLPRAAG